MVDTLSYFYAPRPFKNPAWQLKKDAKPRARNLKQILAAERERIPRRILPSGEIGDVLGCEFGIFLAFVFELVGWVGFGCL